MILIIPLIFGALGVAVGSVVGALTTHAMGEEDRQAAKYHRQIANELTEKYTNLQSKYYELSDETKRQIKGLINQVALSEVEKDCLRLAVRLQQNLIDLMWEIDKEPTKLALKEFINAVDLTNNVLCQLNEELIIVPIGYYVRNLEHAVFREIIKNGQISQPITQEEKKMNNSPKNFTSQDFELTHHRIYDIGTRLLKYLQELRAGRMSEGDKTKGLQSIEDEITKSLNTLVGQKYQVAVIAAMNAGKSTFLNAIIGADVLASGSEACTVCRTDIRQIAVGQTPRLLEYRQGEEDPLVLIQGKPEDIKQKFLERTYEIRHNNNSEDIVRFELEHPVEAINQIPSLTGFTLIDAPGPNEWESVRFNTTVLKQNALELMRTCDVILFILDYTSYQDNTNSELLQDLIEKRREFIASNRGQIYFILNKVDQKTARARPIDQVIEDLRKTLSDFAIPEPIIYPVSSWQGLLAKLIQNNTATKEHKADFNNFFLSRYIKFDEDGEALVPKLIDIAPMALHESGIITIENAVIQAIVHHAGCNLLSEVVSTLKKYAQAIDHSLITEIRGWELDIKELEQKIEEYKKHSEFARKQVGTVKKSVEDQKQVLIKIFSQEINEFAKIIKQKIQTEIDRVASESQSEESSSNQDLLTYLWNKFGSLVKASSNSDPYKMRFDNSQDAQKVAQTINDYCGPLIQDFWIYTQDRLIRKGTTIREELVEKIQKEIQIISDQLSQYIGEALEVKLDNNPIQFPKFEFSIMDKQIQEQQEISRKNKKTRTKNPGCEKSTAYEGVVSKKTVYYYEIDLHLTSQAIQEKIDIQIEEKLKMLEHVIKKQVIQDFQKAEKQINEYIDRFQSGFDYLIEQRAIREVEAPEIIANLESQRIQLSEYLHQLISI